ncbi:MAG: metallophosphoesterase [Acidobacteriota bacterium]
MPALAWLTARKPRMALAITLAVVVALGAYPFWVEPYRIEVTHHSITAPIGSTLRIAHLTDIHASGLNRRERRMLQLVEAEQPHIVLIMGDSISSTSDYPGVRQVLTRLRAPLGVWIVRGHHEVWHPVKDEQEFYRSAGAKLLLNSSAEVRDGVWLVGFDDLSGSPDLNEAFSGVPEPAYKIAMYHSPAFVDQVAGRCNLALSGHTHGGQVRLPLIGPLWLPTFSGEFIAGWFERRGTRMYVSRGIGTSMMDGRFLARPEIAIITIGP